jgi:hypothetical protein
MSSNDSDTVICKCVNADVVEMFHPRFMGQSSFSHAAVDEEDGGGVTHPR